MGIRQEHSVVAIILPKALAALIGEINMKLSIIMKSAGQYKELLQVMWCLPHGCFFHDFLHFLFFVNENQDATYLESPTPNRDTHDSQQTQVIAMSLAAAVVIITIIIWILTKRKCSLYSAYNAPVGMDML
ncbi:UNVERIFIED_CONTAM: hypothetical protein K2H54_054331 [Gekko kuhli]